MLPNVSWLLMELSEGMMNYHLCLLQGNSHISLIIFSSGKNEWNIAHEIVMSRKTYHIWIFFQHIKFTIQEEVPCTDKIIAIPSFEKKIISKTRKNI